MKVRVGHCVVAALSVAILFSGTRAQADSKADAKQHFGRAVALLQDGQVREAIVEFQRAYELKPHYLPLYNIGEAYIQLDQPVEAVEYLERCLKEAGNDISPRKRAAIEQELERYRVRIAVLTINVTPPGAKVRIDDRDVGPSSVSGAVKVALGSHTVSAELEGYRPGSVQVTVVGEEQKTIAIDLVKIPVAEPIPIPAEPSKGQLIIDCSVPEVLVSIDGQGRGQTPALTAQLVPVGKRTVGFFRAGYQKVERQVEVRSDAPVKASCSIRPSSPIPGNVASRLEVTPSEDDAEIRVDGSPFASEGAVPSGLHRIEVRKTGFTTWASDIRVQPRQTAAISVRLVPTPSYREHYESRTSLQRTAGYALGATGIVLGATAIGVYKWNAGRYDDWQSERDALDQVWAGRPPYPPEAQQRQDANDKLIRSIQRSDKVVIGLGIGGGAMLAAGVVVLVTGDNPSRYENVAFVPQSGGGVLGWTGAW